MNRPLIVAITGGSGAIYAIRLLQCLLQSQHRVYLSISPSGADVIAQETQLKLDLSGSREQMESLVRYQPDWSSQSDGLPEDWHDRLVYCHYQDYHCPIASGSFLSGGMVVCPCSGSTLSAIARAASSNLITRAAEVQLKERRKLVLVTRETPLSEIAIDNMLRASQGGATLLPAMPGWYHGVQSLDDIVDFIVSRILDQLEVDNAMVKRWGER